MIIIITSILRQNRDTPSAAAVFSTGYDRESPLAASVLLNKEESVGQPNEINKHILKAIAPPADNNRMGELIQLPNCRQIPPEARLRISERTEKASYWVQRWSEIHGNLSAADAKDADAVLLKDALFYLDGWLQDRNRAAIKARGF